MWKPIQTTETDSQDWDFSENPILEGEYLGAKEVGEHNSLLYGIKNTNGTFTFWDCTSLSDKMEKVQKGENIQVKFNGAKVSKASGRTYKDFSVAIWAE